MRFIYGLSIAALVVGLMQAAPARPLYQPTARPEPPVRKYVDLNGTAWQGLYNNVARTFFFEADGTLSYRAGTSKIATGIKNRGTWRIEGDQIYFEHFLNPKQMLMQFRGTIVDENTIIGTATYLLNKTSSQQTMKRSK